MSFRATALLAAVLVLLGPGWPARALQAPPPPPPPPGAVDEAPLLTPQQLDDLVASIALYPDPLIAQILAAATYPLEVVEADRWLQANSGLQGTALTDAAQNQPWDPSVQALVVFPSVLGMLDRNLAWTINLGNAFLAQAQDVMDAIQRQRQRAMGAGLLASNPQQLVQRSTEADQTLIEILPAQPEVVYVPVYDPVAIWGAPIYHPWPPFWYPPRPVGAIIAAGFVGFFFGVVVAQSFHHWGGWSGWGWAVGWHQHTVVVNNTFYIRNNYRLPRNYIRSGPSPWSHDPHHRGGVSYPSRGVAGRVGAPAGRLPMPAPRSGGHGHHAAVSRASIGAALHPFRLESRNEWVRDATHPHPAASTRPGPYVVRRFERQRRPRTHGKRPRAREPGKSSLPAPHARSAGSPRADTAARPPRARSTGPSCAGRVADAPMRESPRS